MSGNPEHRSFKAASFVTDCMRLPFCLSLRAMKSGRVRPPVLPKQSLAGIRILVGRARHQASALSADLRKLGADVIEIPFIEIHKPRSYQPLDSEEHTSELQSPCNLVCRLLLEKKKKNRQTH